MVEDFCRVTPGSCTLRGLVSLGAGWKGWVVGGVTAVQGQRRVREMRGVYASGETWLSVSSVPEYEFYSVITLCIFITPL